VIVEPIQGEGGVNVPPAGYLRGVRALCDRSGAVFIATKCKRPRPLRALFACDIEGVVPDVMTLAKGLSGA